MPSLRPLASISCRITSIHVFFGLPCALITHPNLIRSIRQIVSTQPKCIQKSNFPSIILQNLPNKGIPTSESYSLKEQKPVKFVFKFTETKFSLPCEGTATHVGSAENLKSKNSLILSFLGSIAQAQRHCLSP